MAKSDPVPAAEFTRNFGHYRMLAQKGAIAVSSHGRITGYFVPPDEYEAFERFRGQSFATRDMTAEEVERVASTRMDSRHDRLNSLLDD